MSAIQLLLEVIREHTPSSKWTGSTLEPFRHVANTNRGDIGEDFVFRYLMQHGFRVTRSNSRIDVWDLEVEGKRFEVKTASEDMSGAFQFNHVRLDRSYDYLFCLGIRPESLMFNAWKKGALSEGVAGTLVRMAEGQSVTHKLTKSPDQMQPIEELPAWIRQELLPGGGLPPR